MYVPKGKVILLIMGKTMIQITIWYGEHLRSLSFAVIVCTDKHIIPYMCSNKTSWLFSNKMKEEQFLKCGHVVFKRTKKKNEKVKKNKMSDWNYSWNTNLRIFQRQLFKVILLNEFYLFSLWSKRECSIVAHSDVFRVTFGH